jgi:hypothetical protein
MKTSSLIRKSALTLGLVALASLALRLTAEDAGTRRAPPETRCVDVTGEFKTAIQVLPPYPSFPPGPFQPILHLLITADGAMTHFGRMTGGTTDQVVDLSANPNIGSGHIFFQTPEGDALWTNMELTGTPADATGRTEFDFTLTVTGGSGRFAGATGTLNGHGSAQGAAGAFTVSGTICLAIPQPE